MNKRLRRLLGLKRAIKVIEARPKRWFYHDLPKDNKKELSVLIHTRKPCSCPGCGNPRKYEKRVTRQELFSLWELQEEKKELGLKT